jgi:hypothetical protein
MKEEISTCKEHKLVNDRMLHTIQRGHWYGIVLDLHAPAENKRDIPTKNSFYEELEHLFY